MGTLSGGGNVTMTAHIDPSHVDSHGKVTQTMAGRQMIQEISNNFSRKWTQLTQQQEITKLALQYSFFSRHFLMLQDTNLFLLILALLLLKREKKQLKEQ